MEKEMNWKRISLILLVAAMLLSLSACVSKTDEPADEPTDSPKVTQTAEPSATPDDVTPTPDVSPTPEVSATPSGSASAEIPPRMKKIFDEVLNSNATELTFSIKMVQDMGNGEEEVITSYVRSGDNYALDLTSASDRYTMLQLGDVCYMIVYSLEVYMQYEEDVASQFNDMFSEFDDVFLDDYTFSSGTVTYNGVEYEYDRMDDGISVIDFYYDKDGAFCYMASEGEYIEVVAASGTADPSYFEIPSTFVDYTELAGAGE